MPLGALTFQCVKHVGGNGIHISYPVNGAVLGSPRRVLFCPVGVILDQGPRLGTVDVEPLFNSLFFIIVPLNQRLASDVVLTFHFWRVEFDVVGAS